ncbi:MAG: betaine--homocysteine S-methyltransferase [Acidimicrobiia bacterium]
MTRFETALFGDRVLVADGAMGTTLFSLGLEGGGCPELLNVERPGLVADVHRRFADAGSDIVLTNTFGGNGRRLALHSASRRVAELNRAAVDIARNATAEYETLIAGSVGPTGDLLAPLGPLTHQAAVEVFAEQIEALVEAGVDVVWIETLSSIEELAAAVEAAARFDVPRVATLSFDTAGRTMMGVTGTQVATWAAADGRLDAVGANCGIGPGDAVAAVYDITGTSADLVAVAKPNCGMPLYQTDRLVYPVGPEAMAEFVDLAVRSGARIIGTCCGSMPEHIVAVRAAVDLHQGGGRPDRGEIEERLEARPIAAAPAQKRRRRG